MGTSDTVKGEQNTENKRPSLSSVSLSLPKPHCVGTHLLMFQPPSLPHWEMIACCLPLDESPSKYQHYAGSFRWGYIWMQRGSIWGHAGSWYLPDDAGGDLFSCSDESLWAILSRGDLTAGFSLLEQIKLEWNYMKIHSLYLYMLLG